MKLSVMCVTQAEPFARPFLEDMRSMAHVLGAEFVLGVHSAPAQAWAEYHGIPSVPVTGSFVEEMMDPVIAACTGDYILRLDDDERCSPGLVHWLNQGEFVKRDSWFFSRCHLWPDVDHCLSRHPYFPDFQVRLAVKRQTRRPAKLHAAHAYPAYRAPALAYLEHHVFLVKTRADRQAITAKYETLRTGQVFTPEQVDVVLPYDDPSLVVERLGSPWLLEVARESPWWREPGTRLPENLDKELREFRSLVYGGG